jgi:manganese efflux pump family protein
MGVSFYEIMLLAVALAMDATAVAGARGLAAQRIRTRDALTVAVLFGGAQAMMPALGWLAGEALATRILGWDHWVTLVVLGGIGAKMIHEATRTTEAEDSATPKDETSPFAWKLLAVLALATSIDALAAGFTLAPRRANIALACVVIGLVTAAFSFAGVSAGHRLGRRLGKRLDVFGGVVLIGLAIKAFVDHARV